MYCTFFYIFADLTTNLREICDNNDFTIAISNTKPKKKSSEAMVETLLAIKYGKLSTKMVLMLDQRSKRGEKYFKQNLFDLHKFIFLLPFL